MLDSLIRGSLKHRLAVLLLATALLVAGLMGLAQRPVDIFPDLSQPIVTVMAEAHGLAPEEVEALVTLPLEAALGGVPGVESVRSESNDGLCILRAQFAWDTDVYRDRQLVQERLQLAAADLPTGVLPEMAPISSITGEILDIALESPDGSVSPMELRTLADWVVRRRLLSVPGVAQVVVIGGDLKQYQVIPDPDLLLRHGVDIEQLATAGAASTENTSGGYLVQGTRELQVRNLGRAESVADLEGIVVAGDRARPVLVRDVAAVREGAAWARGSARLDGRPAVVMEIFKQPATNTIALTERLDSELEHLRAALPPGAELRSDLFRQATFLERGVDNVVGALRDGAILVVLVLLLFLADLRAAAITLVALPLSFAAAGLVFAGLDLSLNAMTLGGLAIAVGELVDDAIVGVENVVRRLRQAPAEGSALERLVATASSEVRGPIFSGTLIVVLVFLPLFALTGIEGRLFRPMAVAYIAALLASMVVSLTVTPALSLLLLGRRGPTEQRPPPRATRWLGDVSEVLIRRALRHRSLVLVGSALTVVCGLLGATVLGTSFLPPFDEGTVLLLAFQPPGTSLDESARVADLLAARVQALPGVQAVTRYSGRGEGDEHAPPPTISHVLVSMDPDHDQSREESLAAVRAAVGDTRGIAVEVGQPLAHRIDHLLSGIQAQIAIKVVGDDLDVLTAAAAEVKEAAEKVPGVTDLYLEPQVLVPQVHVTLDKERLAELGVAQGELAHTLEIGLGGRVVGQILEGERAFDVFVRLDEPARESVEAIRRLPVALPHGGWARLSDLAAVEVAAGPNGINRDDLQRRVAVSCNVQGRSLGDVVEDLRAVVVPIEAELPEGSFIRFEGQFQSQESATRRVLLLSLASLGAMLAILYGQFRSLNLSLQVLVCVPAAFVGGVGLLLLTGQDFNVAALVGFVSLAGIATRNGILLVAHYLHLMREESLELSFDLLVRAGRERAAPVVMTALTTGAGLLPLLLTGSQTGRELLFPVATVVIGGLLTSTLFEFLLRPALFWTLGRGVAKKLARAESRWNPEA
ncbi:MAG: efflux RND transporter permease subunit [Pseudomonadota bacterium]